MNSNSSTSAVGGFFALKYLWYLKFLSHFHCLILVQPSQIHPQTIRTAFQLVTPSARDPPFPIHPTYFVSGTLPKIPLSFSSSREVQQFHHFKSRFPSILLSLTSLVLNILLFLWSGQVLLYTSPQTTISPSSSLALLPGTSFFSPLPSKFSKFKTYLQPFLSLKYAVWPTFASFCPQAKHCCHCGWLIQPWTGKAEGRL